MKFKICRTFLKPLFLIERVVFLCLINIKIEKELKMIKTFTEWVSENLTRKELNEWIGPRSPQRQYKDWEKGIIKAWNDIKYLGNGEIGFNKKTYYRERFDWFRVQLESYWLAGQNVIPRYAFNFEKEDTGGYFYDEPPQEKGGWWVFDMNDINTIFTNLSRKTPAHSDLKLYRVGDRHETGWRSYNLINQEHKFNDGFTFTYYIPKGTPIIYAGDIGDTRGEIICNISEKEFDQWT